MNFPQPIPRPAFMYDFLPDPSSSLSGSDVKYYCDIVKQDMIDQIRNKVLQANMEKQQHKHIEFADFQAIKNESKEYHKKISELELELSKISEIPNFEYENFDDQISILQKELNKEKENYDKVLKKCQNDRKEIDKHIENGKRKVIIVRKKATALYNESMLFLQKIIQQKFPGLEIDNSELLPPSAIYERSSNVQKDFNKIVTYVKKVIEVSKEYC
ncbi:hypothetical protein TRFO_27463 [Tritrichomonas foetus]|uniref:Uncharacterized protein n=1 Tax=Tritrichomonas foetus TaxID=1144522 RepID=A0A1J4K5F9_9EUKA|nr:hypothetical protein TRFO_27463 [Tritrichomonas foetus]|eukprot:OHT04956.1 hypothetical protein TRFO_27463 [Tritrichomonas foetus]